MDLSIVIPHHACDAFRRRNLRIVLDHYRKHLPDAEFVIAEQHTRDSEELEAVHAFHGFPNGTVNTGHARNQGFLKSTRDRVLFVDNDVLIPARVLRDLPGGPEGNGVHSLFDKRRKLTDTQTRRIDLNRLDSFYSPPGIQHSGPGYTMLIRREDYICVGGYPELDGYGFDDVIFNMLVFRVLRRPISRVQDSVALHLFHPPTPHSDPLWRANESKWQHLRALDDAHLACYAQANRVRNLRS